MREPVSELGPLLRTAAARSAERVTRALVPHGVTGAEYAVLRALHEAGAVPPSVVAARLRITRGAVTRLVDRLRAKRLLVRAAPGRDDRRYQTIALTGAGALLVPLLVAAVDAADLATFDILSAEDRVRLAVALRMLND